MAPGPITPTATRVATATSPTAADLAQVTVELSGAKGRRESLGTALEALRDGRLTEAERAAILALVRAVQLLRERASLNGINDAGQGVKLLLREADATARGPWATEGQVAIGTRNGLATRGSGRARADVLLTVDAAIHELTHVVQFGRMPGVAKPHAAILEGIADAAAILATGDDTLGEEFFQLDASGRHRGSIRELGTRTTSGPALGRVVTTYRDAVKSSTEEHAGGGVVSAVFIDIRGRLGRERAEQLLWAVIRDGEAWKRGGSWRELVLALQRQARTVFPGDVAIAAAVDSALDATGLDDALRAA